MEYIFDEMQERYTASLLGCAIGDMLGAPVEMWTKEDIHTHYGWIFHAVEPRYFKKKTGEVVPLENVDQSKEGWVMPKYGEYTDDTILTLAMADSILAKGCIDLDDIASRHVIEYFSRELSDGNVRGGFGKTTRDAIINLKKGVSIYDSGLPGVGAGPAMKMAPIGIYAHAFADPSILSYAKGIGHMTHTDTRAVTGGIVQAHAIYSLLMDIDRKQFIDNLSTICNRYEKAPLKDAIVPDITLTSKISWIKNNMDADIDEALKNLGNGGASFECHPFALFMFQKYWYSPRKGFLETINCGGDADTAGAIYGALAGARNGMIFDEELYGPLGQQNIDRILYIGKRLSRLSK